MTARPRISCRMQEVGLPVMQQHDGSGNRPTRGGDPMPATSQIAAHCCRDGVLQGQLPESRNLALPVVI